MKNTFKIKNWKLSILALLFFSLFISLGVWQLARAAQKKQLLQAFAERTAQEPITADTLRQSHRGNMDWRFFRAELSGRFDDEHTFLLDNKTFNGQVGYEVYTPFRAEGMNSLILIDRGFIPQGKSRKDLPEIKKNALPVTIQGLLNLPPTYVALGAMRESNKTHWPLRIEFINLDEIAKITQTPVFPYIFALKTNDPAAYATEWKAVIMGPEKHQGYAVQWFALALTLLILFVALNRGDKKL